MLAAVAPVIGKTYPARISSPLSGPPLTLVVVVPHCAVVAVVALVGGAVEVVSSSPQAAASAPSPPIKPTATPVAPATLRNSRRVMAFGTGSACPADFRSVLDGSCVIL